MLFLYDGFHVSWPRAAVRSADVEVSPFSS